MLPQKKNNAYALHLSAGLISKLANLNKFVYYKVKGVPAQYDKMGERKSYSYYKKLVHFQIEYLYSRLESG